MTAGVQFFNDSGNLTIDENSISYVYLGKYKVVSAVTTIKCNGWPLVFVNLFHGLSDSTGQRTDVAGPGNRYGVAVQQIRRIDASTWAVTVDICNPPYEPYDIYLRVFGKLHQNPQVWGQDNYGLQVMNADGLRVFDSSLRMLRLAGNTYDTELTVGWEVPDWQGPNNSKDVEIALPFDMTNKSIMANGRGVIYWPYNYNNYVDWDTGQNIEEYYMYEYYSMYHSIGNKLQIRRIPLRSSSFQTTGSFAVITAGNQIVYTRLAVIDNSLFP